MKRLLSIVMILSIVLSAVGFDATLASGPAVTSTEFDNLSPEEIPDFSVIEDPEIDARAASVSTFSQSKERLPFYDVSGKSWYFHDVSFVYANGIMGGVTPSSFEPNSSFTRGQLVTTLYRIAGSPKISSAKTSFTDLVKGRYYYNAVLWASQNDLVNGVTATQFCPENEITREQIATIFYRYYGTYLKKDVSVSGDLSGFADGNKVSNYARKPMAWAAGTKLIQGISETGGVYLQPRNRAIRAQAATFLTRLCKMKGVMDDYVIPDYATDPLCRSSSQIVDFIKEREGFSAEPYWDYSQYSVGYGSYCTDENGRRITRRDDFDKIAPRYRHMSEAAAEALLMEELSRDYESYIERFEDRFDLSFSVNEFDALASFSYNLGPGWTTQDCMLNRCLREAGEYAGGYSDLELTEAMGVWCRVAGKVTPGTCRRRLRESAIFLDANYRENDRFSYARYMGNGSYLTFDRNGNGTHTDDIGYFENGTTFGDRLLVPDWRPVSAAASEETEKAVTFKSWKNMDGNTISSSSRVRENEALTAQWQTVAQEA